MNPKERYFPVAKDIAESKEFSNWADFVQHKLPKDKLLHKIMKEAEWLDEDFE